MLAHKWWTYSYNMYRKYVEEKYIPRFIAFDMNTYEKVGTGKAIAIISKGVTMWSSLVESTILEVFKIIVTF